MAVMSVADLLKTQGDCCIRCKTAFTALAGKLEDVMHLATIHYALTGTNAPPMTRGKLVVVCTTCAREIDRECARG